MIVVTCIWLTNIDEMEELKYYAYFSIDPIRKYDVLVTAPFRCPLEQFQFPPKPVTKNQSWINNHKRDFVLARASQGCVPDGPMSQPDS
mmetsp:Transcript_37194/g.37510  ORF Transcript_37194/g.37510 Transcript_37194/m.37510 type:complete len:89 (+) Transcript_37194:180-446(+)